jgi:hypothetical protein
LLASILAEFLKRKPVSPQDAAFFNCKLSAGEEQIVHSERMTSGQLRRHQLC